MPSTDAAKGVPSPPHKKSPLPLRTRVPRRAATDRAPDHGETHGLPVARSITLQLSIVLPSAGDMKDTLANEGKFFEKKLHPQQYYE